MENLEEVSFSSKREWKSFFEPKYFHKKNSYNSKQRDKFFEETIKIIQNYFTKTFFISCGTLLGYIRENNFIDWDDNIDLSFYFENNSLIKLEKLQRIMLEKHYVARIIRKKKYLKLSIFKYGYKLDLCSLYKEKSYFKANLYKMPTIYCDELKAVNFKNVTINIPKKYENYLLYLYGNWKTPIKDVGYQTHKSQINLSFKNYLTFFIRQINYLLFKKK